jgi:hypothetical protein
VLGRAAVHEVDSRIRRLVGREVAEDPHALLPRDELRDRGIQRVVGLQGIVGDHDLHEAFGLGIGERPQEQGVDDGEDRRVGADADREDRDRRDGKPARPPQKPPGVADVASDVLEEVGHTVSACGTALFAADYYFRTTTRPSFITHRTPVMTS